MIGVLLGKYRVLSKLGEGGISVVYVGRHEALGHSVVRPAALRRGRRR